MNSFEEELKVAFDQCPSIKDTVWLKEGNITLYEVAIHLHNKYIQEEKQRVAEAIEKWTRGDKKHIWKEGFMEELDIGTKKKVEE